MHDSIHMKQQISLWSTESCLWKKQWLVKHEPFLTPETAPLNIKPGSINLCYQLELTLSLLRRRKKREHRCPANKVRRLEVYLFVCFKHSFFSAFLSFTMWGVQLMRWHGTKQGLLMLMETLTFTNHTMTENSCNKKWHYTKPESRAAAV